MSTPLIATLTLNPSLDELFTLERLVADDLNRAESMARYPGGKGINVARVVRELAGRTAAYGFVGGRDGQWLADALDAMGVPHRFTRIGGTTRNNLKILTRRPPREWQINSPGPRIRRAEQQALVRAMAACRPRPAWWTFSGSLPPGVPADIYRRLIVLAHRAGISCALDADGAALAQGVRARPEFIKPNRREAERLVGQGLRDARDAARAAAALVRQGVGTAVISLGAEGAVLASREVEGAWRASSPSVRVRSTIGAGDSLVAGFVTGRVRGVSVLEAFRLGVTCGAACVMTPGTELCHRRDVLRLLPRVRLHRVL